MKRLLLLAAALLAAPALAATGTTGDRIDGVPVISGLDAAALPSGQIYRFWFRVDDTAAGQGWYVPVIVVRGAQPGPKLLLTAAIHGDELNGIDVIHTLARTIDPTTLRGTVTMIPGLNTPGLLNRTRSFTPSGGTGGDNLNRIMPGKADAATGPAHFAFRLWTGLMRPNAETAIDLHTQSHGTAYVMYAFAATPRARRIAELTAPDMIKLDKGVKGTVENTMVDDGVPAITLELGRPEVFDPVMVSRAVEGIERVMANLGMVAGAPALPPVKPFVGNKLVEVAAPRGGFVHILVPLGGEAAKGAPIATISDPFGRINATIIAPETGRINTLATDPLRDPGDMLLRILYWSDDPKCAEGC